jgi:hypothetical protein
VDGNTPTTEPGARTAGQSGDDRGVSNADASNSIDPNEPVHGPDKFEPFTTPSDFSVNSDVLNKFEPLARDMGLTQAEAQRFVDLHSQTVLDSVREQSAAVQQMLSGWKSEAQADAEYGGDNFGQNVQIAAQAIGRFGTPAFREALDETGLGNHPEMIRFAWRVGQSISEDAYVGGQPAPARPLTAAEIFYPTKQED